MKTLKVMSIIGLALGGLSFLFLIAFNNPVEYDAGIGWGLIAVLYFIPFSIVVLSTSSKK